MKRKLMPYLLSYAFLFVSYLIISFIMAILFSFMHVSSFIYQLLITFFSSVLHIPVGITYHLGLVKPFFCLAFFSGCYYSYLSISTRKSKFFIAINEI